jgi:hypothetical protein
MKQRVQANKLGASDVFFDSLVRNAIDFLQMSVKELEKQPKYSVIHFAMSVELFLKARLLREHWSLVVSKIEKASLQAFRNGEFVSVTMDECLQRLGNIANDSLLTHLCLNCFELHDDVGSCGWCGSLITGDTDGTSIWGCFQCGGPDLKD